MMKTLSAFLAVVMVICSAPLSGFVGLELPDWLDFSKIFGVEAEAATYSGSCGTNVNWSLDTSTGVLKITGTGAMYNYNYDSIPWYYSRSSVETVNIAEGVTSIVSYAFWDCDSLTSVTIPDSVTSIDNSAFFYCDSLTSIKVDSNNKNYCSDSYGVLYNKNKTTLIQYPIGNSRETFTIPDSVTSIGSYAFFYCESLTSVTIPDSVTSIGDHAFEDCNSLTSVTIPDSVTSICDHAFFSCDSLTSVTIPDSVTSMDYFAFRGCNSLASIKVDPNHKSYSSDSYGVLYDKNKTTLIQYPGGNSRETFTIPDSVTSISEYAFFICNSLESITIPDSVTSISDYAFYFCNSLTSVTIGDSVTSIGSYAFYFCDSLTSVTIGDSVTRIGGYAFAFCGSLTDVYYTGTEEEWNEITIGSGNEDLLNATIHFLGEDIRAIVASGKCGDNLTWTLYEDGALEITGTGAMTNYISPSSVPWYSYRSSVKTVNIQKGVTSIGRFAFEGCDSLTSVTIPDSVTSIGKCAFEDCDSLTSVTIPDSVESIGYSAFCDCDSLTLVTIPDSVTSIGSDAFSSCDSLTSIKVDSNNKNYCNDSYGVLYNKNKTTLIQYPIGNSRKTFTIPDSVTSIGSYAFYNCDSLTSVTIGDSVESIGFGAFSDCYSLTSVTIGDSVESIGFFAFYDCDSLTSVTIPDSVTSIGSNAFDYCDSLTDVYYTGTEEEWNEITIGSDNEDLLNATIHFLGEEEHSHSYTSEVTKPSTCTEEGVRTYTCSCSDIYTEVIPALGHTWGDWKITTQPTTTTDGVKERRCSVCGETETVVEPKTGITIILSDVDGKIVRDQVIEGDMTKITFEGIEDGEYTVTVSKANYVTRKYDVVSSDGEVTVEFKLNLLGDIDGNGKVNISDYNAILRHVKKTSALDGYAFDCADIDGNGKIMVTDYNAVLRHVKKTEMLW